MDEINNQQHTAIAKQKEVVAQKKKMVATISNILEYQRTSATAVQAIVNCLVDADFLETASDFICALRENIDHALSMLLNNETLDSKGEAVVSFQLLHQALAESASAALAMEFLGLTNKISDPRAFFSLIHNTGDVKQIYTFINTYHDHLTYIEAKKLFDVAINAMMQGPIDENPHEYMLALTDTMGKHFSSFQIDPCIMGIASTRAMAYRESHDDDI